MALPHLWCVFPFSSLQLSLDSCEGPDINGGPEQTFLTEVVPLSPKLLRWLTCPVDPSISTSFNKGYTYQMVSYETLKGTADICRAKALMTTVL